MRCGSVELSLLEWPIFFQDGCRVRQAKGKKASKRQEGKAKGKKASKRKKSSKIKRQNQKDKKASKRQKNAKNKNRDGMRVVEYTKAIPLFRNFVFAAHMGDFHQIVLRNL